MFFSKIHKLSRISRDLSGPSVSPRTKNDSELNLAHLGFHLPARNGGFAIVARFELQGDGARADVGNCHVGWRTGELCDGTERKVRRRQRQRTDRGTNQYHRCILICCLSHRLLLFYLLQHPLVAAQIRHTGGEFSQRSQLISLFPLVHPTSAQTARAD